MGSNNRFLWKCRWAIWGSALLIPAVSCAGVVTDTSGVSAATASTKSSAQPTVPASGKAGTKSTPSNIQASSTTANGVSPEVSAPQGLQPVFLPPLPGMGPAPSMEEDTQSFRQTVVPSSGFALTPQQIEELHEIETESAMATNKMPLVHGQSIVLPVSMAPGAIPPVIHLALGYMTVINFVGSEGNPWPVQYFEVGNSMQVSVQSPDQMGHGAAAAGPASAGSGVKVSANGASSLWLFPMKPGASTNLAVMLKGSSTPLIFPLTTTVNKADYRVTVRLSRPGPLAKPPVFVPGPDEKTASASLVEALQGITPKGADPLSVSGISNTQAWRHGNTLYVRTRGTLVSPGWDSQGSADGYTAYQLPFTPDLLVSESGRIVNVRIHASD